MKLLGVELARLRARRAVQILLLLGLASTLLFAWAAYSSAQPMSAASREMAEEQWRLAQEDWEEYGQEQVEQCREDEAAEAERTGQDVDWGCEDMEPQREWFFWEPPAFADYLPSAVVPGLLVIALVSLMVGVTFVAAEFATGAIGTWLTFEPRRGRVFASKTVAAAAAAVLFGLVWGALFIGANAAGYAAAGSDVAVTGTLAHLVLRAAALTAAITVVGTGLAFVLRHTAASLGVAIGYLIGVDTILLGNVVPGGQRWQLTLNLTAWLSGRPAPYYEESCTVDATGTFCDYVERTVSMTQGGLVLLAVTVAVTAVAFVTFRTRDIAG